jgi:glycosyltransferase involved in cell wall biosynthesis
MPEANWAGTVHYGLPRDLHRFQNEEGGYHAFLGRISQEKGLERAIEIAKHSGYALKIAAKIYDEDVPYFEHVIDPLIKSNSSFVKFLGEIGGTAKDVFLGHAKALLFPVEWSEPFALVMIEALATGTPVIAWRRGSAPEVIQDGVTGFIVDSLDQGVEAVHSLHLIDRSACRKDFELRFTAARMAQDYLDIYQKMIQSPAKTILAPRAQS